MRHVQSVDCARGMPILFVNVQLAIFATIDFCRKHLTESPMRCSTIDGKRLSELQQSLTYTLLTAIAALPACHLITATAGQSGGVFHIIQELIRSLI